MLTIKQTQSYIFAIASMVLLQTARADDTLKLIRTYKEGAALHYKMVTKGMVGGTEFTLTEKYTDTVKEVKPDGTVTVVRKQDSNKLTVGDQDQPTPNDPDIAIKYDKAGRLTDYKFDASAPGAFAPETIQLLALTHHILLPDMPVKNGDVWQVELDNPIPKAKKIKFKNTFLGTERKDGVELWKIKQTVEAPTTDGALTAELTSLLNPVTGELVHIEGTVKDVPTIMYGVLTWTEETQQIKLDAAPKKTDADTKKP